MLRRSCPSYRMGSPHFGRTPAFLFVPPRQRSFSQRPISPSRLYRPRKLVRWSGAVLVGIIAIYAVDKTFNASAITRNCRTLWTCAMITLDYKLNFTPEKSHLIPELHERVSQRMYNLFTQNGGLYIKLGQAIGANAAVLPPAMQDKFAKLFDDAPQIPFSTVNHVFLQEFGKPPGGPGGVFREFSEQAVASASVAQVHKALTWPTPESPDGEWVAVKIQKPDVNQQMWWDLNAYKLVMWLFEKNFQLPVFFLVDFISSHLRQELDFINEAQNAVQMAQLVAADPHLSSRVHIPKVFPELSTKKVMTAEWIDGVRLSDKKAVLELIGEGAGSSSPNPPLKGGRKYIMQTMVELFSAQMFEWGWIHCDPHPGNIILSSNPHNPSYPRLVLLDHGLYVRASEQLRQDWAAVWQAMMMGDRDGVRDVIKTWGIAMPDLFATMTMMRPVALNRGKGITEKQKENLKKFTEESEYERSARMKKVLKGFLVDTDKMPKELIFVIRSMRMVQAHNQSFGAPVNRIRITADYASRSLTRLHRHATFRQWCTKVWHHTLFRSFLLSLDAAFYWNNFKQWIYRIAGWKPLNFEESLESMLRGAAKEATGIEMAGDVFQA